MCCSPSSLLLARHRRCAGAGLTNAVIAVAIVTSEYARIVRSVVLGTREEEFVQAASAVGACTPGQLFRHYPAPSLRSAVGAGEPRVAFRSSAWRPQFPGSGHPSPAADWGEMLNRGRRFLPDADWLLIFPGLAISITVLGFNLLGDGIRDASIPVTEGLSTLTFTHRLAATHTLAAADHAVAQHCWCSDRGDCTAHHPLAPGQPGRSSSQPYWPH